MIFPPSFPGVQLFSLGLLQREMLQYIMESGEIVIFSGKNHGFLICSLESNDYGQTAKIKPSNRVTELVENGCSASSCAGKHGHKLCY